MPRNEVRSWSYTVLRLIVLTVGMGGMKLLHIIKFYCSGSQFRRCLDQHLGLVISDEDYKLLVDKYDVQRNGMVNYRKFTETLEKGDYPSLLANYELAS